MRRGLLSPLWLLGPGTALMALMLGSCAKVDYEEETVTQTFEDPTVFEVDCATLTLTSFSTPDNGSGTGLAETMATGGTPPYAHAWADSTGAIVGQTSTVLNLPSGLYTVDVTDSLGCSVSDTVEVEWELSLEGEVVVLFVTSNSPTATELMLDCDPPILNVPSVLTVQPGMSEIPIVFPENTLEISLTYSWSCGNEPIQGPTIGVYGENGYPLHADVTTAYLDRSVHWTMYKRSFALFYSKLMNVIGSVEWCGFPKLGIPAVKARVDSGAKTSSLQANKIKPFIKDGQEWVKFEINPIQDNRSIILTCEERVTGRRLIKNTSGISEERLVITSLMKLGEHEFKVELTLANRDTMEFRMLLGRDAFMDTFLVDVSQECAQGDVTEPELKALYQAFDKEKDGLRIAILASNPKLYSNKRIIEAGEARGHEMVFLNVEHSYMKLDVNSPEIRYRGGNILNQFDAIIPRIKPAVTFYGCALLRQFKHLGVYCLNSADAITQSRDKLFASLLFSENDINIPITGFAKSPQDTKDLIRMVNGAPLIIKLLESTQGRGVVLAETDKAAESVINAFKSVKANILVQEFIKEANGQDIRCFVVNGKVVAAMQRQAEKGEFRANIHQGGTASIIKITSDERRLAIKAAKTLNLAVAGVDIIRSNKGPLLLEVNSSPGLEGIEKATGIDIANSMILAIERRLKFNI